MNASDFDLKAMYDAIDERRRARQLSWSAAAREISRSLTNGHPIAVSTITGIRSRTVVEGDGILQMLLWLDRSPESFLPGFEDSDAERFRLRQPGLDQTLRWNTRALHVALNARRQARGKTWNAVAQEIGGFSAGMLANLSKGGRIGFPRVMRIVRWLDEPAANFTFPVNHWPRGL